MKKKIVFSVGYLYLAAQNYIRLSKEIQSEFETLFLNINPQNPHVLKVNNDFSREKFQMPIIEIGNRELAERKNKAKLPFWKWLYRGISWRVKSFFYRPFIFLKLLLQLVTPFKKINVFPHGDKKLYFEILEFLNKEKPHLVVVNSDLGHEGILYLLDLCRLKKIRTLIIPTCDIDKEKKSLSLFMRQKIADFLSKTSTYEESMTRCHLFTSSVIGTFDKRASIVLGGEAIKEKLIREGIKEERVSLAGIYPRLKEEMTQTEEVKFVTFYSECLHEIYDIDSVKKSHAEIAKIFASLRDEYQLEFRVKPHPREIASPTLMASLFESFEKEKISIVESIETETLIKTSFLNVAHYSRVLITSCMLSRPIISFCFLGERSSNVFLKKEEAIHLELEHYKDFKLKIKTLLKNSDEYQNQKDWSDKVWQRFDKSQGLPRFKDVLNKVLYGD